MGPAGIGKGSSEATRTGLATATGAGTGTGGAGATAAGAAVGAPPWEPPKRHALAARSARALRPSPALEQRQGARLRPSGPARPTKRGHVPAQPELRFEPDMEPQNLEPNRELGLVAARSSPRVSAAHWVRRCHRQRDRSPLPEPGMQPPPADRPCRRQAAGRIQRPCSPSPQQESENERPAYALIRPGLITCLDGINAVYG